MTPDGLLRPCVTKQHKTQTPMYTLKDQYTEIKGSIVGISDETCNS